ncbi:MAG: hypothetical protein LBF90_02635 [Prevotellaceae bacterium]|jgi:hypothetical protein|nr:hypothetical protein [Prevotellaceae bacterium]
MKKIVLYLLLFLCLAPAFGQSVVRIDRLATDYAAPSATLRVYWEGGVPNNILHLDSVWLFVDYQPIASNGSLGVWTPATLSNPAASAPGTVITVPGNGRGFYLRGTLDPSFSSTVTVTLAGPTPGSTFNWCAYASDYPPNATLQSNGGGYALHGTPPFVINGSIREPSYTFDDAGVCITSITDSTGCPGFVVNPPIVPGSIPSTGDTVCAGDTPATIVGLMPFGGGDGQLAYSWYKDGVLIADATGADYTPPSTLAPGTYIYTRKVNDRTCGVAPMASTGSWRLTVGAIPATTLTASSPTVCAGAAVTLTATAGAALYSFNGGAWLANNTTRATVNSNTTFTVKARSTLGCESAEATTTVAIQTAPTAPTGLTSTKTILCNGVSTAMTLTASGGSNGDGAVYQWGTGATVGSNSVATTTANTYSVSPNAATTYWVRRIGNSACTASTGGTTVAIATVVASVAASSLCEGGTSTLTATVSGGTTSAMTYSWNIGGSISMTTGNTKTTQVLYEDTPFTLTVTNANGCSVQTSGTITVTSPADSDQTANDCGCAAGLENCSGTCKGDCCTNCFNWTTCSSVSSEVDAYTGQTHSGFTWISNVSHDNTTTMTWRAANSFCASKGTGWRLPTLYELECMCANKESLPSGYAAPPGGSTAYWSTTFYYEGPYYSIYHVVFFGLDDCGRGAFGDDDTETGYVGYVGCVK